MTLLNGFYKIYTNADTKNSGHWVIRTSSRPHTPSLHPLAQVMFPYCTNRINVSGIKIVETFHGKCHNHKYILAE
jgi:hypothetical protein